MSNRKHYIGIDLIVKDAHQKALSVTGIGGPVSSLPIPLIKQGALKISFLYYPFRYQNQSVYTPAFLQTIDAESGEMEEMRASAAKDFGLNHGKRELLGHLEEIPGITRDEIDHNEKRLYILYDKLLPEFADAHIPVSDNIKASAIEFKKLFYYMSEAPLRTYYHAVGKDFFSWLDRVARQ